MPAAASEDGPGQTWSQRSACGSSSGQCNSEINRCFCGVYFGSVVGKQGTYHCRMLRAYKEDLMGLSPWWSTSNLSFPARRRAEHVRGRATCVTTITTEYNSFVLHSIHQPHVSIPFFHSVGAAILSFFSLVLFISQNGYFNDSSTIKQKRRITSLIKI